MKKTILHFASLIPLFYFASCGSSADNTKTEKPDEKENISNDKDVKEDVSVTRNCCFKTVEEGFQFLPVLTEGITAVGDGKPGGSVGDCIGENRRSSFHQRYMVNGTEYLFKLEDMCADPGRLPEEYERSHKNMKIAEVFNDLDKEGVYKAFGTEDKKRKLTYVFAMVDGRFKVTVTGFEKTKLDEALMLLACVPFEKLAAFGK